MEGLASFTGSREAARGDGVAREGAGRADDGGQGLRRRSGERSRTEEEEGNSGRVRGKRSRGASWSMLQDQERAWRAIAAAGGRRRAWRPRAMLGQRRGRVACAEVGQRRRARAAAGLGATRGSCQRQEVAPAELQRQ
jgi:hypothetical protein